MEEKENGKDAATNGKVTSNTTASGVPPGGNSEPPDFFSF